MEKTVSKGLKQPFFSCCGCRNPTGKQGQNGLQKCLLVKFRRWNAEKSPQIPAVRGFSADAGERASTLVTVLVRRKR